MVSKKSNNKMLHKLNLFDDDDVGVTSQTVYNFSNMFQLCLQIESV